MATLPTDPSPAVAPPHKQPAIIRMFLLFDLALVVAYLLLWPVPIEPVAWTAPEAPPPVTDTRLAAAHRVELPAGHGAEDIDVDTLGRVYGGVFEGPIYRWTDPSQPGELFVDTGGRPLGLHWDTAGNLLVADARRGLLSVSPAAAITPLCPAPLDPPIRFADDLETAPDGTIYFTDASHRFGIDVWKLDLIENQPSGRLLRCTPGDDRATVVLDGLHFANGVAVDPAGQYVLVVETARYRVKKVWIEGPRAGEVETFVDNLPGFPDGISTGSGGVYWLAIGSPRNGALDATAPWPSLRKLIVRLPDFLQPAPVRSALVLGFDEAGRLVHGLGDPTGGRITTIASVQERAGRLYFGSLSDTAWAWIDRVP